MKTILLKHLFLYASLFLFSPLPIYHINSVYLHERIITNLQQQFHVVYSILRQNISCSNNLEYEAGKIIQFFPITIIFMNRSSVYLKYSK